MDESKFARLIYKGLRSMEMNGAVRSVEVDGYERLLAIATGNRTFVCRSLQHDEYLDPGQRSAAISIGDEVAFSLVLKLAPEPEILSGECPCALVQEIPNSPHAELIGTVAGTVDLGTYVLVTSDDVAVVVEFESDLDLPLGECIRVRGELTAESLRVTARIN